MRFLTWIVSISFIFTVNAEKIRIVCIGDSITFGSGIKDRNLTYPAQLQKLLGPNYEVKNFGNPGRGVIKSSKRGNGMRAFIFQKEHKEALAFNPHVVICNLGINDIDACKKGKWAEFTPDYIELINSYKNLQAKPQIFIWTKLAPLIKGHRCFDWQEPFKMRLKLSEVVESTAAIQMDMFSPLIGRKNTFLNDAIHPNENGAKIIAETTLKKIMPYLSGKFGGLKLPYIFSDNMVFQRNAQINVFGKANAGQSVTVSFLGKTLTTQTSNHGKWLVSFPPQKAGGPYNLTITANEKVSLKNIMIGEVWISAGQSNMRWTLSQSLTAKTEIPQSSNNNIRLLNRMRSIKSKAAWSEKELDMASVENFYQGHWQESNPQSSGPFSAVAYYFAKEVNKYLKVPVGIINIPIGGTICEAFISENSLLENKLLSPLVSSNEVWTQNKTIPDWCRKRAALNLTKWFTKQNTLMPSHQFQPSFLYQAAIDPIKNFPIKGVTWYQGESNATMSNNKTPLDQQYCEAGLKTIISDWRKIWGKQMPFFFVQLPGLNRNWMEFREMQLNTFNSTPNTGVVVTTDLGHPTNVHPKNKKAVGERLSLWALNKTYGISTHFSGPIIEAAVQKNQQIILTFKFADSGFNNPEMEVSGFEIFDGKNYKEVSAKISGKTIIINGSSKEIRYNWVPDPKGNLRNLEGLPASPFRIKVQ